MADPLDVEADPQIVREVRALCDEVAELSADLTDADREVESLRRDLASVTAERDALKDSEKQAWEWRDAAMRRAEEAEALLREAKERVPNCMLSEDVCPNCNLRNLHAVIDAHLSAKGKT